MNIQLEFPQTNNLKEEEVMENQKKMLGFVNKYQQAKELQSLVKQHRSESALDFLLVRDGRACTNNISYQHITKQLVGELSPEQKLFIWKRTMEFLALLSTKRVFLKGDIVRAVHVGTKNRLLVQLMPVYVTQCQPGIKQLLDFRSFLDLENSQCAVAQDYLSQVLGLEKLCQVQSSATATDFMDASSLSELSAAVRDRTQFICFQGNLLTPPQLFGKLREVLSSDERLIAALIARHMQHSFALPSFEFLSEELVSLTEAQDQAQFKEQLEAYAFKDQFLAVPEERMTRKMYRLIFGLTETPIDIKANHHFQFDFCDYDKEVIDVSKPLVTKQQHNAIYAKLKDQSKLLPEIYRARILAFLQIFHHAVLEEGEDYGKMRVDGVVLYCPKGLADSGIEAPGVEVLKDFVNCMINPFSE